MRFGALPLHQIETETFRLNGGYYLSTNQRVAKALEDWKGEKRFLKNCANIFRGPIFSRTYIEDPTYGEPYVSASDLDRTDYMGCRIISKIHGELLDTLRLKEGMTIITCSGVNLGWGLLVRKDMDGLVGSHDLIRLIANDPEDIGYLAAYLCSEPGWVSIRSLIYGTSIKHIEPDQVAGLSIPWFDEDFRFQVGKDFLDASEKRAYAVELIREATDYVFRTIGINDLTEQEWCYWGRELGFVADASTRSLRGWNYSLRTDRLRERIKSVDWLPLLDLVQPKTLSKGPSFSRIDAVPPHSIQLMGQRQLFRYVPRGRQISRAYLPKNAFCKPGTILIAARGTFGESEVFCRTQYVSRVSSQWCYSNDILRVIAQQKNFSGWLYAFLRSKAAFRILRSIATGSKQQDLHPDALAELPIPVANDDAYNHVQKLINQAFTLRDEAYVLEARAKELILKAVLGES